MSNKVYIAVALVIIAGIVFSFNMVSHTEGIINEPEIPVKLVTEEKSEIHWYTMNEAIALNATTGKKIFIDVYTNWCGPCKWLDQNTFHHPVIMELLETYFIPVKFNAEGNDTISFNGQVFVNKKPNSPARMSTHDFTPYIASTPQGIVYPTMVFLNEKLEMIQPITGALKPEQIEPILEFIGGDHYLTTEWSIYQPAFQSKINN